MTIIGMPGVSGVVGECQLCGKTFIAEIMLGAQIKAGKIAGIEQEIALHGECAELLQTCPAWDQLPNGPLRQWWEAQQAKNEETE